MSNDQEKKNKSASRLDEKFV